MTFITTALILGMVIFISHMIQGITGFGCTVMALPFAIMLVGISQAVPILIVMAFLLAAQMVWITWKDIQFKALGKIVGLVLIGMPVGIWSFVYLNKHLLTSILGGFMVLVAMLGLITSIRPLKQMPRIPAPAMALLLIGGGFFHGAFSSGGPLVVIYAKRHLKDKAHFRGTLSMLWLILNSIMIVQNTVRGVMTTEILLYILICLPFLVAGVWLGNKAHHKIKDQHFSLLVYIILLISGILMF